MLCVMLDFEKTHHVSHPIGFLSICCVHLNIAINLSWLLSVCEFSPLLLTFLTKVCVCLSHRACKMNHVHTLLKALLKALLFLLMRLRPSVYSQTNKITPVLFMSDNLWFTLLVTLLQIAASTKHDYQKLVKTACSRCTASLARLMIGYRAEFSSSHDIYNSDIEL